MQKTRIALFLSLIQVVLFLGHYLVYKTFIEFFGLAASPHLSAIRLIFFILSVGFLAASALNNIFYGTLGRLIYRLAAVWMGTFYWLFISSIISSIVYILGLGLWPTKDVSALVQSLMAASILISLYGLLNSHSTRVKNIKVNIGGWHGKKGVMISDTHFGSYWNMGFARKIVSMINAQNPDIVFIAGDFFDGPPADYEKLAAPFKNIRAKDGVWFAPGNHEEFRDSKTYFTPLSNAGIKILNNQLAVVEGVEIIGVGFGAAHKKSDETAILKSLNLSSGKPKVLIKHEPSHIDAAEEQNISLQLSGHTHMGQVYPLNYITKRVYGVFHNNLQKSGKTLVYTSSGAGSWGPPQRVGNHAEIVVINFE